MTNFLLLKNKKTVEYILFYIRKLINLHFKIMVRVDNFINFIFKLIINNNFIIYF